MKLLILSFCCLVLVCLNGVASQRVEDGGWIEDTDAVADELDSIFGEEESDEEKPRIYLGGLVGGGTSIRTNIFTPSVTNDCICPTGSECECCTSDEVNSKTITGCVTVSKAEVPGTVNAVFYFNGLRVSKSIFSVQGMTGICRIMRHFSLLVAVMGLLALSQADYVSYSDDVMDEEMIQALQAEVHETRVELGAVEVLTLGVNDESKLALYEECAE
ncbi:hypothetical protein AAG570_011658 [Ranatra chinensis]|uniref:Uncharacterized protein n=1 Tax=Ranatra chinensis TaxID=642074 RepID=A0ABD0YGI4_9HEMI